MTARTLMILPYFGRLPAYFSLWLQSCDLNRAFDWLIVTDGVIPGPIPPNVRAVNMTFDAFRDRVRSSFTFKVHLETPYKLCDFRPAYGYLFSDELRSYEYWGYCDCDTIWGNLDKFIVPEIERGADKVMTRGHFTVLRNTPEVCNAFTLEPKYETVLGGRDSYHFDELVGSWYPSINSILRANGLTVVESAPIADPNYMVRNFEVTVRGRTSRENLFVWDSGDLHRYYVEDGMVRLDEVMYLHLQKRRMAVRLDLSAAPQHYVVTPDSFISFDESLLTLEGVIRLNPHRTHLGNRVRGYRHFVESRARRLADEPELWRYVAHRVGRVLNSE